MATVLSRPEDPGIGTHFHKGFATAQTMDFLKHSQKTHLFIQYFCPSDFRPCVNF